MSTTTPPPPPTDRRRAGVLAWLAFGPVALWLLLLVAAPTLMLVAYSFCDTDPDLGEPIAKFTWDNYAQIFESGIRPTLWHAGIAALVGSAVAVAVVRRVAALPVRLGFLLGGCGYLSYAFGVGSTFAHAVVPTSFGSHLPDFDLPPGVGPYVHIFWNSVEMAALATGLCLAIGYPVALFIGRSPRPWRDRLLLAVMIPFWTSFLIRTYAWVTILNQHGLLNAGLRTLHLGMLIPASGAVLYTPAAVVLGLVYAYLPFMILPIYASVERLDDALIEASLDLGAGPLRTLARVVLPLTSPGISAGVLLVFVPAIGMYAVSSLLGGGARPMIGDEINNLFNGGDDQPLASALAVTLMATFGLVLLATGVRRVPAG
jgi:spermidine/putrescine transport system permease protein